MNNRFKMSMPRWAMVAVTVSLAACGDGNGGGSLFSSGTVGSRSLTSSRRSAATRFSRQIATGSSSTRVRRHAGSHGRSHVRPRIPGNTFDSRFSMYDSVYLPAAMSRMYSGTFVCAGHPH